LDLNKTGHASKRDLFLILQLGLYSPLEVDVLSLFLDADESPEGDLWSVA
jgi:hypothetical protein